MGHRQYFKVIDPFTNPQIQDIIPQLCPANGYYDPAQPLPYIPDPNIPTITPDTGEIVLVVCDALEAAVALQTTTSTGQVNYSIYGDGDTLLDTNNVNSNAVYFKELPTAGGIALTNGFNAFKIKITAVTGNLTVFKCGTYTGWGANGWPILEAHIKAPTLTSLVSAFTTQKMFLYAKFYGSHNNLTSLNSFAYNAPNFKEVDLGDEMNNLQTMYRAFSATSLEVINFPATLDNLTTLEYAFSTTLIINQSNMPMNLPSLLSMQGTYSGCKRLSGTIFIPNAPLLQTIVYLCQNAVKVKKVVALSGYEINTTTNILAFDGCLELEEVDLSAGEWGQNTTRWGFSPFAGTMPNLKKIKLPTKIKNLKYTGDSGGNTHTLFFGELVTEVSSTVFEYYNSNTIAMYISSCPKLKVINFPTLRTSVINHFGTSTRQYELELIEIDWTNSTGNINFRYTNLPVAEIDRIFTALPTEVGTRTIDVRNTPGYATCDKSIATAKGWTVL